MTKRKKSKRSPNALYYLIAVVCAFCLSYEPIADILPEQVKEVFASKTETALPADAEARQPAGAEKKPAADRLEIPARLKDTPELLLQRRGYTVSYNRDLKIPNWVAWELTPEKLVERESRTDKFLPDPDLPEAEAVTTDDYKGSGMDRGHMCPAGDNRWHWKAMQESFYMTNICPQDHNLNRGDWKELEEACRRWAQKEGRIYIVCGPILYKQKHRTIGRQHKVTVPEGFFKVVLCADSRPPKAIGFIYKNQSENRPMEYYARTVDEVESVTGIDFFPALPDKTERKVEAEYDLKNW